MIDEIIFWRKLAEASIDNSFKTRLLWAEKLAAVGCHKGITGFLDIFTK